MLKIKPLSVNKAWKGRRIKTDDYEGYEEELYVLLPKEVEVTPYLYITFGFSNKASDIDNPVKPFLDILQQKYEFNDSKILELHLFKKIVPRGEDYISFEFKKNAT